MYIKFLGIALGVALCTGLVSTVNRVSFLEERAALLGARVYTERLIGAVIDPPEGYRIWSGTAKSTSNQNRLLRFVDISTCPDCLDGVSRWADFVSAEIGVPVVILAGVGRGSAAQIIKQYQLQGADVFVDSIGAYSPANVQALGEVRLLTDQSGLVIHARGRYSGCEWPFENYLADLGERLSNPRY